MNAPDRHPPTLTWPDRLRWLVATCGGFGYCPILPGTCGALWGVAIYVPLALGTSEPWQTAGIALALAVMCVVTFRLSPWAERYFQEEDSGKFVTDEVVGFLTTALLFRTPDILVTVLWAFPVTRILDMIKPPPARRLEHLPAGWGVLADDILDSLYAAGLLHVLRLLQPEWFAV
jgi:phosphatidylglycerophosphatase A